MKVLIPVLLFFSLQINAQIQVFERFEDFEKELQKSQNDTHYIYNFWATWCKPCVEELPFFTDFSRQGGKTKTKVIFVSLDSKKDKEKLKTFVEKNLTGEKVIQLTDNKYNDWIDKIDPQWSGSIPATLFIAGNKKSFHEKQFDSFEELLETWITFLKQ